MVRSNFFKSRPCFQTLLIFKKPAVPYPGQEVSWDDFLPSLSYVIVACNRPHVLIEVEYMMELLEPSWLGGEGTSTIPLALEWRMAFLCLCVYICVCF